MQKFQILFFIILIFPVCSQIKIRLLPSFGQSIAIGPVKPEAISFSFIPGTGNKKEVTVNANIKKINDTIGFIRGNYNRKKVT